MNLSAILEQLELIDHSGAHDAVPGLDVLVQVRQGSLTDWMTGTLGVAFVDAAEARAYWGAMRRVYAELAQYEVPRRALSVLTEWTRGLMAISWP